MTSTVMQADIVVVGGGAAGLMAAIWAGRTNPSFRIILLDGATRLGAKILISGGGRCNITHDQVDERAFAGSTPPAIRKILRRFDVPRTVTFFNDLDVDLKREQTGKLFPVTDHAKTVLDALLTAAQNARVNILTSHRVEFIQKKDEIFEVCGNWGRVASACVILASGGKSVAKTGSDGHGYSIAQSLGHSLTPVLLPALVPLLLPADHFLRKLSGISALVELQLRTGSGRIIRRFRDSLLCTHFGVSGPAVLDMSRYYLHTDRDAGLFVDWLPDQSENQIDSELRGLNRKSVIGQLRELLPDRLAIALCEQARIAPALPGYRLTQPARKSLVRELKQMRLPVTGNRGFSYAEVTAGGVPLNELNLQTLESRICSRLYLCGEICDVDGQIGGFNFQWAWASGYVAGTSAATR